MHIQGKLESNHECPGKGADSDWPKKILSVYLRLILEIETVYNNQNKQNRNNNENQQTLGKGEKVISRVITLLDSNVQFITTTKNHKTYKKEQQKK